MNERLKRGSAPRGGSCCTCVTDVAAQAVLQTLEVDMSGSAASGPTFVRESSTAWSVTSSGVIVGGLLMIMMSSVLAYWLWPPQGIVFFAISGIPIGVLLILSTIWRAIFVRHYYFRVEDNVVEWGCLERPRSKKMVRLEAVRTVRFCTDNDGPDIVHFELKAGGEVMKYGYSEAFQAFMLEHYPTITVPAERFEMYFPPVPPMSPPRNK
jgi:hypothetical protein